MYLKTLRNIILFLLFCVITVSAGGLRTQLGEVVVENLQIGQSYNLVDLANLSLRVTNTSEYAAILRMDLVIPQEAELKHGALPIPDLSWISLSCDSFSLDAGKEAVSDVIINIPDDEQYLGRSYQFMIWSHTVPGSEGGMFLATGLKSRIIFTTDSIRAELPDSFTGSTGRANFSLSPSDIHLNRVPVESRYDVRKATGIALLIENPSADELTLRLYSKSVSGSLASLEPGWEDTPDPGYLTFEESEVTVAPNAERSVDFYLNLPGGGDLRGKHLMFLIHASDETRQVRAGVYARVYVTVE